MIMQFTFLLKPIWKPRVNCMKQIVNNKHIQCRVPIQRLADYLSLVGSAAVGNFDIFFRTKQWAAFNSFV